MALVLTSSVVCVICFGDWMCHFFLCPFSSIRVYNHKSCPSTKIHGFFKCMGFGTGICSRVGQFHCEGL